MVADLILLGIRAGGGHNALEILDHADKSRGLNQNFNCLLNNFLSLFLRVGRGGPIIFNLIKSSVSSLKFTID